MPWARPLATGPGAPASCGRLSCPLVVLVRGQQVQALPVMTQSVVQSAPLSS